MLHSDLEHLTSYTEVIQDGMIDLIDAGKLDVASATAFSLSPDYAHKMNENAAFYRDHIILRPQEISNHPEVIRRLGVIGANGMIEAIDSQGWRHLGDRPDGLPRRPHRARRHGYHHRARHR